MLGTKLSASASGERVALCSYLSKFFHVMLESFDGKVAANREPSRHKRIFVKRPSAVTRLVRLVPFGGPFMHKKFVAAHASDIVQAERIEGLEQTFADSDGKFSRFNRLGADHRTRKHWARRLKSRRSQKGRGVRVESLDHFRWFEAFASLRRIVRLPARPRGLSDDRL